MSRKTIQMLLCVLLTGAMVVSSVPEAAMAANTPQTLGGG